LALNLIAKILTSDVTNKNFQNEQNVILFKEIKIKLSLKILIKCNPLDFQNTKKRHKSFISRLKKISPPN
jgi:hypothetical protein